MTTMQIPLIRVFISSPGDVASERKIAREVIDQLNYEPQFKDKILIRAVAWDHPYDGAPMVAYIDPQEAINRELGRPSECEIVVVILWSRIGTPMAFPKYQKPDGTPYQSGTEWEYLDALNVSEGKHQPEVVVYHRIEKVLLDPDDSKYDERLNQYRKVKAFFADFRDENGAIWHAYTDYEKPDDFRQLVTRDLRNLVYRWLNFSPAYQSQSIQVPAESVPVWQGSPFPGLRAFTDQQAEIFFGRGRETDDLVEMVKKSRFVAVISASGAGKSSLVAAGLIPRLRANAIDSEDSRDWLLPYYADKQWHNLRFTPGEVSDNPFQALAVKLAPIVEMNVLELTTLLIGNMATLDELLKNESHALFFIDQFEELFTVVQPGLVQPFIMLIDYLAKSPHVHIVITLRADFYYRCLDYTDLSTLMQGSTFPLATPNSTALREMIAFPADRAELRFATGLIDKILEDTGNTSGALALMAYTLDELYRISSDRGDHRITIDDYYAVGGVRGAIGKRAELVFAGLSNEVQNLLPKVFHKLVLVNEEGIPTRKRVELAKITQSNSKYELVEAFINARLLISDSYLGQATLEVAHEALFISWIQLADWIRTYKDDLTLLNQVYYAAAEWNKNNRSDSYSWNSERLAPVYTMIERFQPDLDEITTAFIQPEINRLIAEYHLADTAEYRRHKIIEHLVEIGIEAVPPLLDILKCTPKSLFISNTFKKLANLPYFIPYLIKSLRSSSEREVAYAAYVLGEIKDSTAVPALIDTLYNNEYKEVRLNIVIALGKLGDPTAVIPLVNILKYKKDKEIWPYIIHILGKLGDSTSIPVLIEALKNDKYKKVKRNIIEALGELHDPIAIPVLVETLQTETNKYLYYDTVFALGQLGEVSVISLLTEILVDEFISDNFKIEISKLLNKIGKPEALEAVRKWQEEHQENQKGDPD